MNVQFGNFDKSNNIETYWIYYWKVVTEVCLIHSVELRKYH